MDSDETIESTNVFLKRIDFTDSRSITLTSGMYKLYLTSTDSVSGAVTILFQSESVDFDSSVDFMLIAEPDETTFSGFTLNMLPI